MDTTDKVTAHYHHGALREALLGALSATGKNPEALRPEDMEGADEFHIGAAGATRDLSAQLGISRGMHLLDVGSGIGGPARHLAHAHGCRVTGVDLSGEFVAVAQDLTRRMGLGELVDFHHGSADALGFAPGSFDGATLLHVGMNIPDKAAVFAAVHRALRPGGFFAVYDVMRVGEGEFTFPVPWASEPETSFVETPDAYRTALQAAGFRVEAERERRAFARDFFAAMRVRMAERGLPGLGLHIVMGPAAPQKVANMVAMIERGIIAPVEIIARK